MYVLIIGIISCKLADYEAFQNTDIDIRSWYTQGWITVGFEMSLLTIGFFKFVLTFIISIVDSIAVAKKRKVYQQYLS